jgi:hypothetical protein
VLKSKARPNLNTPWCKVLNLVFIRTPSALVCAICACRTCTQIVRAKYDMVTEARVPLLGMLSMAYLLTSRNWYKCTQHNILRRRRQGGTLKERESGLPGPGRRELDPHLRPCQHRYVPTIPHTSTRARAYACACHARPSPPSIRANRATQRHYRARAYPSNSPRNHTRRTIYSDYFHHYYVYSLLHPRPHAHPHAPIVRRCAQYVPVDHASCCGNNSSSAALSASMLSASHKSICCMSCEATV